MDTSRSSPQPAGHIAVEGHAGVLVARIDGGPHSRPNAGMGHTSPARRGTRRLRRGDGPRLASFDRRGLATAKSMVNQATLPPDADLVADYGGFVDSLTTPGFLARAVALGTLIADKGLDVEHHWASTSARPNQTS
jgi:hypothetical protein